MSKESEFSWFRRLQKSENWEKLTSLGISCIEKRKATQEAFLSSSENLRIFRDHYLSNYSKRTHLHPRSAFENPDFIIGRKALVLSDLEQELTGERPIGQSLKQRKPRMNLIGNLNAIEPLEEKTMSLHDKYTQTVNMVLEGHVLYIGKKISTQKNAYPFNQFQDTELLGFGFEYLARILDSSFDFSQSSLASYVFPYIVPSIQKKCNLTLKKIREPSQAQLSSYDKPKYDPDTCDHDFKQMRTWMEELPAEKPRYQQIEDATNEIEKLRRQADLTEREDYVLDVRFGVKSGEPKPLSHLAKQFQCSRERVRQIESKALHKIRVIYNEINRREELAAIHGPMLHYDLRTSLPVEDSDEWNRLDESKQKDLALFKRRFRYHYGKDYAKEDVDTKLYSQLTAKI